MRPRTAAVTAAVAMLLLPVQDTWAGRSRAPSTPLRVPQVGNITMARLELIPARRGGRVIAPRLQWAARGHPAGWAWWARCSAWARPGSPR